MSVHEENLEEVIPQAADFVRSIAEQGYKIETALADLIDNSIAAGADKIEILVDTTCKPFTLYVADNGRGMSENELKKAMRFPSSSVEKRRTKNDLGRFGLGLKTASFSQTRSFSVITRNQKSKHFSGRTWDLSLLDKYGWKIKVETKPEIDQIVESYLERRTKTLGDFHGGFQANTIVVWRGLYKFEKYISERDVEAALNHEITHVINNYLSIVFHRFMERAEFPVNIKVNNVQLKPFNPFVTAPDVRIFAESNRVVKDGEISIASFILPLRSIEEAKESNSKWVPDGKSLMDMEGIYLYRSDRIILFGSWLGLAKRSQKMQLSRMRIDVDNSLDHLMHLNISKSQVEMPRDLIDGLRRQVTDLRLGAEREYQNRTIHAFPANTPKKLQPFLTTKATNRGAIMQINSEFPILQGLQRTLNDKQLTELSMIVRMFEKELNDLRKVHETKSYVTEDLNRMPLSELTEIIKDLLKNDIPKDLIKENVIIQMGFSVESLPDETRKLLD